VDAFSPTDKLPMSPLYGVSMQKAGEPSQRHGEFPSVTENHMKGGVRK